MQLSLADLNKRIKNRISPFMELVKGEGYFYFTYYNEIQNQYATRSVYVPYIKDLTNARWMEEGLLLLNEVIDMESK